MTPRREQIDIALDSLAAIAACERNDFGSAALMIDSYSDLEELSQFARATAANAGYLLRMAAHASGIPVDVLTATCVHLARKERERA
jgi:hypothetical protein